MSVSLSWRPQTCCSSQWWYIWKTLDDCHGALDWGSRSAWGEGLLEVRCRVLDYIWDWVWTWSHDAPNHDVGVTWHRAKEGIPKDVVCSHEYWLSSGPFLTEFSIESSALMGASWSCGGPPDPGALAMRAVFSLSFVLVVPMMPDRIPAMKTTFVMIPCDHWPLEKDHWPLEKMELALDSQWTERYVRNISYHSTYEGFTWNHRMMLVKATLDWVGGHWWTFWCLVVLEFWVPMSSFLSWWWWCDGGIFVRAAVIDLIGQKDIANESGPECLRWCNDDQTIVPWIGPRLLPPTTHFSLSHVKPLEYVNISKNDFRRPPENQTNECNYCYFNVKKKVVSTYNLLRP